MRLLLVLFLLFGLNAQSQSNLTFALKANENTIHVNKMEFYLSKFIVYKGEEVDSTYFNDSYLIDFDNAESLNRQFNIAVVDSIQFSIGIDSVTSTSGAFGGELDPTNGMYWAWQSGYINVKMELEKEDIEFVYHLGGYRSPYTSIQSKLFVCNHESQLNLIIDVDQFLEDAKSYKSKIMSPGKEAYLLSVLFAENIKVSE